MSHVPKAVLYHFPSSIWCSVVLLALEEKGYAPDEIDLRIVDISKGENYDPSFLRLNRKATVPTLVVPLENSLAEDEQSRYKALNSTRAIVDLLDKSRSAHSRTNTTSQAPAPSLSPATVSFSSTTNQLLDLLHSPEADPNNFTFFSATDDASLDKVAQTAAPFLAAQRDTLVKLLADDQLKVSDNVKNFWREKKAARDTLLGFYTDSSTPTSSLSEEAKKTREEYFTMCKSARAAIKEILEKVTAEIIGPYVLGDQISIVDLHFAAWLTRILLSAGVGAKDEGAAAVNELEKFLGSEFTAEQKSKLATVWESFKGRESWKKVYKDGLH
ncbi:hypothetical protein CYLTODRAFT_383049 [Cylindrobasidium torrendii FP15055 ss-10]|uniref:GST N-terminal domain-containing protein n=1 Tax=Cylindrobasidium torrendii FP15055 ss-10 TaxID=1314674 RepID=A0A0D7AX02_9AGAR|nr:hypothetical protein CYLTODRAFT_383049 [Cylindrobasidium torrendii FP15055 ss-10]